MKKYKSILDVLLLIGLGIIALLAIAPESIVMPSSLQMCILALVFGLVSAFMIIFWKEQPNDERELQNQALASRLAYLVGSAVLIIALVIESLRHELDPAIPIALLAMIATKIIVQKIKD